MKRLNKKGIMVQEEKLQEFIVRRVDKFEHVGIAAFDIETMIDNVKGNESGKGNCYPYLLCLRGTLVKTW